jgi:hypothetical protein
LAISSELVKYKSFEGWIVHGFTVFGGVALQNQFARILEKRWEVMNKEKSTSGFFQLFPPFSALGKILTTELLLHPESCPPPIRRRWGKGLDKSCFMFVSRCGLIFFLILCVHCWCSLGGFRSGKNCNRMKDLKGRVT